MPEARLIVHGFPWKAVAAGQTGRHDQVITTNGPPLPDSTTILVASRPQQVASLAARFLGGDGLLGENLSLLGPGEGMILAPADAIFSTWRGTDNGED